MWLGSALFIVWIVSATSNTIVEHVDIGQQAILPCPSNDDDNHRFLYWQIADDSVIGPENTFNTRKYKYEVWSGRLFIKSVSSREAGLYKCISKHIANAGLSIQAVELVVNKIQSESNKGNTANQHFVTDEKDTRKESNNWDEVYVEDPQANTYRAVVAILVLLIVCILATFAFFVKKRRTRNFSELMREESPDEGPSSGGITRTYNPTTTDKPSSSRSRALDNAIVETDIKTSFSLADYP